MEKLVGNPAVNRLITGERVIPQALLLAGPRGCGRNYAARLIAARYIGTHPEWVMNGTHPDCLVLRGQGASGQIPIRAVREATAEMAKSPAAGQARAVIIRDCEALGTAAANALLKSLEEPPRDVVFILTAEGASSVPATVLSRCELCPVCETDPAECLQYISSVTRSPDAVRAAEVFPGRIGLILKAAESKKRMEAVDRALALKKALLSGDKTGVMTCTAPLKTREEAQQLIGDCMIALERQAQPQAAALLSAAAEALRGNMPTSLCFAGMAAGL